MLPTMDTDLMYSRLSIGVPQGFHRRLCLFNILINDIGQYIEKSHIICLQGVHLTDTFLCVKYIK